MSKTLIERSVDWGVRKSPWLICFNGGACACCTTEAEDAFSACFDLQQLGAQLCEIPCHADVLLVTGSVDVAAREQLLEVYRQMPQPKYVIAVGACACSGGVNNGGYADCGGVGNILPVDIWVPGCPVHPRAVIAAVQQLLDKLNIKSEEDD